MPSFIPAPRALRDIDRQLRHIHRDRQVARSQLAGAMADLARLETDEDTLLELRAAEASRRSW